VSIVDWFLLASTVVVLVWYLRTMLGKDRDKERHEEDDARAYFDAHGHWPDETPEDVARRRAQADEAERIARAYQD